MYRGTLASGFVNISVYFNIQPVLAIRAYQILLSSNRVSLNNFYNFPRHPLKSVYLNTHSLMFSITILLMMLFECVLREHLPTDIIVSGILKL